MSRATSWGASSQGPHRGPQPGARSRAGRAQASQGQGQACATFRTQRGGWTPAKAPARGDPALREALIGALSEPPGPGAAATWESRATPRSEDRRGPSRQECAEQPARPRAQGSQAPGSPKGPGEQPHQRQVAVLALLLRGRVLGQVDQVGADGLRVGLHVDGLLQRQGGGGADAVEQGQPGQVAQQPLVALQRLRVPRVLLRRLLLLPVPLTQAALRQHQGQALRADGGQPTSKPPQGRHPDGVEG